MSLSGEFMDKKLNRPFQQSQTDLMNKMKTETENKKYKAVCFKMEDTLTVMPFSEFSDLFLLMNREFESITKKKKNTWDFAQLRLKAQESAEKKFSHKENVTIYKIYDIIGNMSGISREDCERLMNTELELVVKYTFPRDFGEFLFRSSEKSKKKVFIVSESIYPRHILVKILSKCGFETCRELILKSELQIPDTDKRLLFEKVIEKTKVSAEKLLYIGSNVSADVEIPVMNGAKALLVSSVVPLMIKSGRLRSWIQAKYLYDYDKIDFLAFHILMGLYSLYGFDVPQNKVYRSDFCNDPYMIGFVVLGGLSFLKEYQPDKQSQKIIDALNSDERVLKGLKDFKTMYGRYFDDDDILKNNTKGCESPLIFVRDYFSEGDRQIFKNYMEEKDFSEWCSNVQTPDVVTVYGRKTGQNFLAKLADKMFPPNTKVRNMVDAILFKMKSR